MVDDNAINPETGETIYVGILEKLPEGFRWIYNLHTDDWLKIVRGLTSRAADGAWVCDRCGHNATSMYCSNCNLPFPPRR